MNIVSKRKLYKSYRHFSRIIPKLDTRLDEYVNLQEHPEQNFEYFDLPKDFPQDKKEIYEIIQDGFAKLFSRADFNLLAVHMDMDPRDLINRLIAMRFTRLQAERLHHYLTLQALANVNIYKDRARTIGEKSHRNPQEGESPLL